MSEIIFAVPRTIYHSYQDLYALIDLSGFKKVFIDEIDSQSDNAYIVTILNGEIGGGWPDARAHIVVYDLEWRTEPQAPIPGVAEFWAGDKWHAELCQCRYAPMGSHPGLRIASDAAVTNGGYDVAYIGYIQGIHRREVIRQQLIERGVNVSPHGAWGEARHAILSSSKAYLHIHQLANAPGVPALRMVVAAAYSLCVISERCADAGIFEQVIWQPPYEAIVSLVLALPEFDNERVQVGQQLHDLLCSQLTFRRSVENAL